MGKYPNSTIHSRYSDWHYNLIKQNPKYKKLYVSDIDRLWIEYDFKRNEVVGIIDLKYENNDDSLTPTEKGIYEWFEKRGVKVYTVYIDKDFEGFTIINKDGKSLKLNSLEYADFLLSLRNPEGHKRFCNNYKSRIKK